jgi:hypothetical protein
MFLTSSFFLADPDLLDTDPPEIAIRFEMLKQVRVRMLFFIEILN